LWFFLDVYFVFSSYLSCKNLVTQSISLSQVRTIATTATTIMIITKKKKERKENK